MSEAASSGGPGQPPQSEFDPSAPHQQRPKLRPVRGFAAQAQGPDGQVVQVLGLADARQVSERVVFTMPAAQVILPLMDGTRGLDAIVAEVGRGLQRPMLEQLVGQLDGAGLLEGPTFDAMRAEARAQFDASGTLPPASSANFADGLAAQALGKDASREQLDEAGPRLMREQFDRWIAEALKSAETPAYDELPRAIVAPHLDYPRGWVNYAGIYGRLRVCDRPDRVVILGTNHFGFGTGVVGCDKGYETPLGTCEVDSEVVEKLRQRLGETLFAHRFDHEKEHSIELQVPWVQHAFGPDENGAYPRVFGALVHDPCASNGESYDGSGVALAPFIEALREVIAGLGGRTLVVSSADLSHMGPAFGDQLQMSGDDQKVAQKRTEVQEHDRQMLDLVAQNKPSELIAAMSWQQNPTRWCSVGNLVATLMTVQPERVEMIGYAAAVDGQGMAMVSSASAAMW